MQGTRLALIAEMPYCSSGLLSPMKLSYLQESLILSCMRCEAFVTITYGEQLRELCLRTVRDLQHKEHCALWTRRPPFHPSNETDCLRAVIRQPHTLQSVKNLSLGRASGNVKCVYGMFYWFQHFVRVTRRQPRSND